MNRRGFFGGLVAGLVALVPLARPRHESMKSFSTGFILDPNGPNKATATAIGEYGTKLIGEWPQAHDATWLSDKPIAAWGPPRPISPAKHERMTNA